MQDVIYEEYSPLISDTNTDLDKAKINSRRHLSTSFIMRIVRRIFKLIKVYIGTSEGRGRGGGGERERDRAEDRRNQEFKNFRDGFQDHQGGSRLLPILLTCPPNFQVLPEAQVGRSKISGAGASGRAESREAHQSLVGARWEAGSQ